MLGTRVLGKCGYYIYIFQNQQDHLSTIRFLEGGFTRPVITISGLLLTRLEIRCPQCILDRQHF